MRRTVFALSVVLLAGCQASVADPAIVTGPRILAVRAEPPEVAPGEAVRLEALVVDTAGATSWTWSLCALDPVLGSESCAEPERLTPISTEKSPVLIVPTNALMGLSDEQRMAGIPVYLSLNVAAIDGPALSRPIAVKSVRISERPERNRNPVISFVTLAGSEHPVEVLPDSWVTIEGKAAPGSLESYVDAPTGIVVKETLRFHWFVSDGSVGETTTEPEPDSGLASTIWHHTGAEPAHAWVVLYDTRGGVDWRVVQ